jgi:hypothetical protein
MTDPTLNQQIAGQRHFQGENPARGTAIHYYLKSAGEVKLAIADGNGKTVRTITSQGRPGINRVMWNLQQDPPEGRGAGQAEGRGGGGRGGGGGGGTAEPGTYVVTMTGAGKPVTKPLTILEDRWMQER